MSENTDLVRIKMATADMGTAGPTPMENTIKLNLSDEDGTAIVFELDMLAAALLQMTLGMSLKATKAAIEATDPDAFKPKATSIPDDIGGLG